MVGGCAGIYDSLIRLSTKKFSKVFLCEKFFIPKTFRFQRSHSSTRTRLLGHEGYSKTTSTSGIVHVKANTCLCRDVSRLGTRAKVSPHSSFEFMRPQKRSLSCSSLVSIWCPTEWRGLTQWTMCKAARRHEMSAFRNLLNKMRERN
jgi:hypothetical protein